MATTVCPYCNIEVSESSIEAEDGCCPECGSVISTPSSLMEDEDYYNYDEDGEEQDVFSEFDEEDDEFDDDEFDVDYEDEFDMGEEFDREYSDDEEFEDDEFEEDELDEEEFDDEDADPDDEE